MSSKIFRVRKTFQYTEIVEVVADDRAEAEQLAMHTDGDRNHDDTLYDCEILSESELEPDQEEE